MKRARGFTIAELLVALAITSLLVVLLVSVVSAALNVWEQGRNQIDTFSNARQTLSRIANEIKGAAASPLPNQIEFSENLTSINNDPPAQSAPVPKVSENIFFVAPYPNLAAGDLCVIAYRHNNTTHILQRAFVDSQNAWSPTTPTLRYQASGYNNLDWRTVATGVLEFEIRSYSQQDLDDPTNPIPADSWSSMAGPSVMIGNTPRRTVIRIKVIDDRTLVRLSAFAAGSSPYNRLVNRAAREFTADVVLLPPH
jgi:type II secretory pathway component PulJ